MEMGSGVLKLAPLSRIHNKAMEQYQTSIHTSEPCQTLRPRFTVWLWFSFIPPALTFVLIFILVLLLIGFDVEYKTARLVLGFEADIAAHLYMRGRDGDTLTRRKYFCARKKGRACDLAYVFQSAVLIAVRHLAKLRVLRRYPRHHGQ